MAIPTLFTSPAVSSNLAKFGPTHWNNVTGLLTALLDGPEADGLVLARDAASPTGASWTALGPLVPATRTINGHALSADVTVTAADVGLSNALVSTGTYADPTWLPSLAAAKITGAVASATLAAGATVLATPRSINGVSFNGSADITVPAAAGTLTGATLAAGVTASSLTSAGASLTVGGALDLRLVSTDGLVVQNTTAATAGVTIQYSPRIRQLGTARNTSSLASEVVGLSTEVRPNAANPATFVYAWTRWLNGATFDILTLTSAGSLTTFGLTTQGDTTFAVGNAVAFSGRVKYNSPADSQLNITNNAASAGVGLNVATDAVLKVRTRAQTGYATLDCLGLQASGAAGVSFGPAHPASITIVNGIVTACA